ncbi:ABC-type transport auxiliary lipoprotein family protein [Lysobacter sp. cf310]|uniref:ABC-type transport auxiliary lipoprotein family protein n=1 Tax=Lysobacter sp. cf310 TaxID=1761790 RepID=UPI0008E247C7|nr:ABC-type transport auxiliary lipoprotein family protein [Lysobacter sp. cf310]SFK44313.1 cholesterol transport system auxiliary component [Lysobacter sp. cf310]
MTSRPLPRPYALLRRAAGLSLLLSLSACSILGDKPKERSTLYAPDPRVQADAAWPNADWQLSLTPPTSARMIDSLRIAVRPTPNEMQVYKGAGWAKPPGEMLQDALLRALEDSGRIDAVARQGSGVAADYKLVLDLRRFESDYNGQALPSATIEVSAKLLHNSDQKIAAARTFVQSQRASTTAVPDVVAAFDGALAAITRDLGGWILSSGNAHEQAEHPRSARR